MSSGTLRVWLATPRAENATIIGRRESKTSPSLVGTCGDVKSIPKRFISRTTSAEIHKPFMLTSRDARRPTCNVCFFHIRMPRDKNSQSDANFLSRKPPSTPTERDSILLFARDIAAVGDIKSSDYFRTSRIVASIKSIARAFAALFIIRAGREIGKIPGVAGFLNRCNRLNGSPSR